MAQLEAAVRQLCCWDVGEGTYTLPHRSVSRQDSRSEHNMPHAQDMREMEVATHPPPLSRERIVLNI